MHVVDSVEEVEDVAGKMLNQVLVTKQTGETGKLVSKIMVAEAVDLKRNATSPFSRTAPVNAPSS